MTSPSVSIPGPGHGDVLRAPHLRPRRRSTSWPRPSRSRLRDARKWRGAGDEEAAAWTWGIARHQLSRWYRRGAVERRALARLGVERRELTDPEYERIVELGGLAEARGRVAARLAQLSDEQREALRLRVVESAAYEEVAAVLRISEQTARARVSRALRALAGELEHEEVSAGA